MSETNKEQRAKFWAAVLSTHERDIGKGYINRHTLDVALYSSTQANYELGGEDLWLDARADRAKIDASPDDWIEIPKFDQAAREKYGDEGHAKFAQDFLDEHDLPVPPFLS